MKFVCEKSTLLKILSDLSRCVAIRSSISALEGIHITVEGNFAYFESFNIEFGIQSSIEISEVEDGSVVVPSRVFVDIVKRLPNALVCISSEKLNVSVNCLDSNFSISCIDPSDFPKLPQIEDEQPISIQSSTLKNMIKQTIFAVSSDVEQNIHSGELIEVKDKVLTIVAVDGFRMSVRKERVNIDSNFKVVVPGKALSEVIRLLPSEEENITLFLSERYIFIRFGNYTFLSRLLDGNFIDYESTIPKDFDTKVKVNVQNMIESIERVSVVIDDRLQSPVKGEFKDNSICFSCTTPIGTSQDTFENKIEGNPIIIAFNDKYMIDALKNCDTDEVILSMTSPLKPIKIVPTNGESFVFIILPVRMKENQ